MEELLNQTTHRAEFAHNYEQDHFGQVARNFEEQVREVAKVEIAQSEVKVHRQMQGALHQQGQDLKTEQSRLRATRTEAKLSIVKNNRSLIMLRLVSPAHGCCGNRSTSSPAGKTRTGRGY